MNHIQLPWYVTVFLYIFQKLLNRRLTVEPKKNLIQNITADNALNNCQSFTHVHIEIYPNMRETNRGTHIFDIFEFPHFRAHNYAYNT